MKKKSNSRSAFFYLRVSIGMLLILTGVFLALVGVGKFSAQAEEERITAVNSSNPLVPAGFDCAQFRALALDKQENLRAGAIAIYCGEAQGGSPTYADTSYPFVQEVLAPLFGGTDVDLVTGTDTITHPTQSETYTTVNPDDPNNIFVAYNDSRTAGGNYSGGSFSTDAGLTFTRLTPNPFSTGHGTNFGDPVALYNKPSGSLFAIFLATGCGGQGIGSWKSTDGGVTWVVGACIHNGGSDDRESGWADNNPASPFYGRMYVSWNDFAAGGNLKVRYSTDNGVTWPNERQLAPASPFIRDVQITGDMSGNGTLYVAGMDEHNGLFPHNDTNYLYRSTDGGNSWSNVYIGPLFPGPGVTAVGYFACMFADAGGYWRHEGWGEPAAFNNVVSLVYSQHGPGADAGDVYYIRSTDSGATFGAPFKLNTDTGTRPQWQANISASPNGTLLATWYDGRDSASCSKGNPAVPCYAMWSRKSTDNGATWSGDEALSDVTSPLPGQPDATVQTTYAGDYDYGSALSKHYTSWTDGRVTISGQSQQDAFTDSEATGAGGGGIVLDAEVQTKGDQRRVALTWSPADGGDVDVLRNGAIVATTADDGAFNSKLGTHTGTFTYQVCETPSGDCSNEVVVTVP
jgi:hypothetical protein